jgi:hypothetical protein
VVNGSGQHFSQVNGLFPREHGTGEVLVIVHPHLNSVPISGGLDVQLRAANFLDSQ